MIFIHIDHEKNVFYWNECRDIIIREPFLLKHQNEHTGENPLQCIRCVYISVSKSRYLSNMYKKYLGSHTGENPYRCYKSDCIAEHLCNHTGERPFRCYKCDSLAGHLCNHKREKPFKSQDCLHSCLIKRKKIHKGEKSF